MEKKVYFRPVVWLIVVSLLISLLPVDFLTAYAETNITQENLKEKDTQSTENEEKLIQAPKTLEEEDRKQIEEINNETTIVKEDANQYQATFYDDQVMMNTGDGMKAVNPALKSQGENYVPHQTNMDLAFSKNLTAGTPFMEMTDQGNETRVILKGIEYKDKMNAPKSTAAQVDDNVIWHKSVLPGVDLRHITLNQEVKEDVILKERQADLKSIIYEIETDKTVTLTDGNEIEFKDAEGEVSFKMPKPEMSDSNIDKKSGLSEKSYAVKYDLKKAGSKYILKVIPDGNWLNDEARVYPVYIDPTFAKDVTLDTFVSSAQPDTNLNKYWNSTLGQYVLRVGKYDAATGTNYAFMKFPATNYLKGALVSSAKISAYTSWNYYGATKMGVWLDKVNATWSEIGVTWNTKPTSTNITSATAATNEWLNFNVLSYAKGIAEGKSDYGVKLHTNGNGQTYWKQLSASENATNKSKLTVVYSYPKMSNIQTTPYTIAGTRNGYINVSWPSMLGAKAYKLQMFDGLGW
ncbi:DNRLRE domain-containing protein [Macrococcus equipercicus]|nr:DNRLRE domain-containing protein [Macrococcus equipercicus]